MASAAPTPLDLYLRVREVTGATSDFDMALKLTEMGVPVLEKTLLRMKKGGGVEFETTVGMLRVAGWLSQDGEDPRSRAEVAERLTQHLEGILEEIRDSL